jgi:biopolymer transport protein TolR
MAQLIARGTHGRRRGMNEINMVPFIDVMLVLLIIFMVSAPLITTGVIDLPKVGQSKAVELLVGLDQRVKLKAEGQADPVPVTLPQLVARVKAAQRGDPLVPVVISAERKVPYEAVVDVMNELQKGGVQRVGLSVTQGG